MTDDRKKDSPTSDVTRPNTVQKEIMWSLISHLGGKQKKTSDNDVLPDVFRRGENSIYSTKSADGGQIL